MRLEIAAFKAVKYACLKFHYAKAVPTSLCAFSVFNGADEWCGVIIFSSGSNQKLGHKFGLVQGQVCELVRMALNGKQESTSQALSMAIKELKKHNPLMQLIVSYADCDQDHIGTIYQATNWIFEDKVQLNGGTPRLLIKGKVMHGRSVGKRGWKQNIDWIRKHVDPNAQQVFTTGKLKYLMSLNKYVRKKCMALAKPYPKKVN